MQCERYIYRQLAAGRSLINALCRFRWTLLPKERDGNSLGRRGSTSQPSSWEADTLRLS